MSASPAVVAAFVRRDWTIAKSYRLSFALGFSGALFQLVLLYYVAELVDRGLAAGGDEADQGYFAYVVVGLSVLQIVQSALRSFAVRLRDEQMTGTLEALLATPTSPSTVILGSAVYDLLRSTAQALLLLAVGIAMGVDIVLTPAALATSAFILIALVALFAGLGVAVAAFIVVFKQGATLSRLIASTLALLGGVYFPVELLPAVLRWLAATLPFTWGVTALRSSLLYGDVAVVRVAGLAAAAAVGLPVALLLFRRATDHAHARGSLAQY